MDQQFLNDVIEGLSKTPKSISSRYFYDKTGDALFQQIMDLPEYYLTRSEFEIFQTKSLELIQHTGFTRDTHFELIDLGAGDATKTKELIKLLLKENYQFSYIPVDISQNALTILKNTLKKEFPTLKVAPEQGDYFEVLQRAKHNLKPKLVLFLGSNIGNLTDNQAQSFLKSLGELLLPKDYLALGVDLIKDSSIVLPAYNDAQGVTAEFNLNLLNRMNAELGTNFITTQFKHVPMYDSNTGFAESFLESTMEQQIQLNGSSTSFHFKKGERIHTEISRKYNEAIIKKLLQKTKFKITKKFTDSKNYFANFILKIQE